MGNDQNLDGIVLKRGIEHQWVLSIMGNPPVRGAPPYLGAWRGLLRRSLHGRRQVRRNEWRLDRTKGRFGRHCKCARSQSLPVKSLPGRLEHIILLPLVA
jgi:hypothetical protein